MKIEFASCSIPGRRDYNQDYVLAEQLEDKGWLFVIADGMGGTNGGEVASTIAAELLFERVKAFSLDKPKTLKENLKDAFRDIQNRIKEEGEKDIELNGMGTTVVCLLIVGNTYVWASLGDSRLYKVDSKGITQLTEDHTFIQDYLNKNGVTLPDEISSQYDHMLTKSIDGNMDLPDIFPTDSKFSNLHEGDCFLLCSDGLILDKVHTNTQLYKNYVLASKNAQAGVNNLVGYAYEEGSKDNISAIMVKCGETSPIDLQLKSYPLPESGKTLELKTSVIDRFLFRKKQ